MPGPTRASSSRTCRRSTATSPLSGHRPRTSGGLGRGRVSGYCLDLAHLYVASNFRGWDYGTALAAFEALPVVYHHLSNSPPGSVRDRHILLDAPDSGVPFEHAIPWVAAHRENMTCLEFKTAGGGVYDAQLAAFDALYRRYGPE